MRLNAVRCLDVQIIRRDRSKFSQLTIRYGTARIEFDEFHTHVVASSHPRPAIVIELSFEFDAYDESIIFWLMQINRWKNFSFCQSTIEQLSISSIFGRAHKALRASMRTITRVLHDREKGGRGFTKIARAMAARERQRRRDGEKDILEVFKPQTVALRRCHRIILIELFIVRIKVARPPLSTFDGGKKHALKRTHNSRAQKYFGTTYTYANTCTRGADKKESTGVAFHVVRAERASIFTNPSSRAGRQQQQEQQRNRSGTGERSERDSRLLLAIVYTHTRNRRRRARLCQRLLQGNGSSRIKRKEKFKK
ncbi:unnamed protein product [Trichogramma brassicae]|uniref:Uncharacterized protein n=1 Tax=Trichogramma brassicae TaxID=86971 RepID=A0A6H5I7V2_9HYME|nr:unnamed protein product [Trichogramma brassicae]